MATRRVPDGQRECQIISKKNQTRMNVKRKVENQEERRERELMLSSLKKSLDVTFKWHLHMEVLQSQGLERLARDLLTLLE